MDMAIPVPPAGEGSTALMTQHERFHYQRLTDLRDAIASLGVHIPVSEDLSILATPTSFGAHTVPNRLAIHPMEGCDGEADGRPGPLTMRRYERFAASGAGVLWVEACAVVPEGRANPLQLWITQENVGAYAALIERMRAVSMQEFGPAFTPLIVLQLTHAGRYSKPSGVPAPVIAHHSIIDSASSVTLETPVVSDAYLDDLQQAFVNAALLAQEAGFDAVDVKACHRYLLSELLASFTREGSRYGGSFENRTRFVREVVQHIRDAAPALEVTSRLNVYDALAYPYGWGVRKSGEPHPDLTEPKQLVEDLTALGVHGVNITIGNPYYFPHFNRPYDRPIQGGYVPEEHPLESIGRFIEITEDIQRAFPDLTVLGSGYSWLRHLFPQVAAGVIKEGGATIIGLGREAFAYPDFARDILTTGRMDPRKCCIACSGCTQMMRDGVPAGCMARDAETYGAIYRGGREATKV